MTEQQSDSTAQQRGKSYAQMIWEEYCKQAENLFGLGLTILFFIITFIAPLVSSQYPFYWATESETKFPWFRNFLSPEKSIDYFYNIGFLSLIVTIIILLGIRYLIRTSPWRRSNLLKWGSLLFIPVFFGNLYLFDRGINIKRADLSQTNFKELYEKNPDQITAIFPLNPYGHTGSRSGQSYLPPMSDPIPQKIKQQVQRKLKQTNDQWSSLSESKQNQLIMRSERVKTYKKNHPYTTATYILGADEVGSDILASFLFGARASLAVGFIATILSIGIGTFLGALAGYFGGAIDMVISRALEVVIMFPRIILIIAVISFVQEDLEFMLFYIMVIIGLIGWPGTCRLIRNMCLQTREEEYITAARALGGGNFRIIFKHVLPNSISPLFVSAPFAIAGGILLEGGLGFLGFTGNYPSWGKILYQGRQPFPEHPHLVLVPVVGIFLAVTAYNLIGSGLRDAIDPKMNAQ